MRGGVEPDGKLSVDHRKPPAPQQQRGLMDVRRFLAGTFARARCCPVPIARTPGIGAAFGSSRADAGQPIHRRLGLVVETARRGKVQRSRRSPRRNGFFQPVLPLRRSGCRGIARRHRHRNRPTRATSSGCRAATSAAVPPPIQMPEQHDHLPGEDPRMNAGHAFGCVTKP